jgi:hypothetical protein
VSSAVGETVAGVVRETVRAVLADPVLAGTSPERFVPSSQHARPLWTRPDDRDEEPWYDNPDAYPPDDDYDDAPPACTGRTSAVSRLPRAIAVGFHTTLRWLRCNVGRYPVLTALTVGVLTALATYAGGPLAAAAVGLAGSAFNLLSLAGVVHAGADALATFGPS